MRLLLLVFAVCCASVMGLADTGRTVKIQYSNPGLVPAQWTLVVHPDGSAHFRSERGNAPREEIGGVEPPDQDVDVHLSADFAHHVFQIAQRKRLFQEQCESHLNVAFQGTKTLTYQGPDGRGSCEFNYSRDPEIQNLGNSLISVATTLIEGARLEMLLRHDPLGLDKETETLVQMAADGRVQQIGSIREILQQLAGNDDVLDRVRKRAQELLNQAGD
jgi:hypothetical protein